MMLAVCAAVCAVVLVARPRTVVACFNGVEWDINDDIRVVRQAERLVEKGAYKAAAKKLRRIRPRNAKVAAHAKDLDAVIQIRLHDSDKSLNAAIDHLQHRSATHAGKKDVRYRAWLAEAYVEVKRLDEAREILVDLQARDLMPDAYAYLTLARLLSGPERLAAWKACRIRTSNKDMCELPAETRTATAS